MDDRKHHTLQGVRQVIANYTIYWHKLAVDSMIFIVGGCLALTGFSLSRTNTAHGTIISISLLIFILGAIGAVLCRLIESKTELHRDILVRIDRIDLLLEKDAYVKGDSIYPEEWKGVGKGRYKDPIFRFCFWVQSCLPVLLMAVIVLTEW